MPSTWTYSFNTAPFKGTVELSTGLFINGQFVDAIDGGLIE